MMILRNLARDAQAGALVPFLGAGVSIPAQVSGNGDFSPTVDWLMRRILQTLELSSPNGARQRFHDQIEALRGTRSLDRLSEVAAWVLGRHRVVEAVRLELFTQLEPLPAHRYIARMAREGWVREVITTNYDTCLEQAWRATFRHERAGDHEERWPAVIVTGEQYQRLGRPSQLDPVGVEGSLRIYKINGCAMDWRRAHEHYRYHRGDTRDKASYIAACERIMLADPQLADPGRPWKADLLRDRMRSRRLVYSGFEGEEAQIRYTFLAVDGETRGTTSNAEYTGPVVHVYRRPPGFTQLQLLSQGDDDPPQPDVRGLVPGGHEIDKIEGGLPEDVLPADDFWRILYRWSMVEAVVLGLKRPRGRFRSRLVRAGHLVGANTASVLANWLHETVRKHNSDWRPFDEAPHQLGSIPSLMVQTVLHAARAQAGSPHPERQWQYYRPLRDDSDALCCLLYLMAVQEEEGGMARGLESPEARLRAACRGILPVRWQGSWHRALVIDSGQALQAGWRLDELPREWLPSMAVDLGERCPESQELRVDLEHPHGAMVWSTVPCVPWSTLLPRVAGAM